VIGNSIRLYLRYIDISMRSQMQYRGSFLIHAFAHFLITGLEFIALAALFQRFGHINGWTLPQMGLFYGIISVAFAFAEAIPRGFDKFSTLIKTGDFDRMLLRPRSTAFQVLGQELQLMRVGRMAQGVMVLWWSGSALDINWTLPQLGLLFASIAGGVCLFSGLFIQQATLCFWTTESLEVANCTTYGGVEAAQFPLIIYHPWFRSIFTFVIPLATINYFPVHAILGRTDPLGSTPLIQWLSPLAGVVFLLASLRFWKFGVKHYTSTGH
jgi:ABC-2 type transport system permease protein